MKFFKKLVSIFTHGSSELKIRLLSIFAFLALFNVSIWSFALISSHKYPILLGLAALAYGLGLKHAVDADHIAVIDNSTRKLMQDGKRPVAVGFFFSLGHSTIVVLLSVLVAISASFVKNDLPAFKEIGSLIGTSISASFLLIIGTINLIFLIDIFKTWKMITKGGKYDEMTIQEHLKKRGIMTRILTPFLKKISNSWDMYIIGFLFGLGFDTASEVGLLSISAASGASGMPIADILVLPLIFTAGMTLIDTLDGILMLGAYGWAYVKPIRKLYYNMNITFISVVIALFIGGIEALQILSGQLKLGGSFFGFINNLDFGNLGYIIIATFLASWIISFFIYKIKGYDL